MAAGPPRSSELLYEKANKSPEIGFWPNPELETLRRLTGSPHKEHLSYKGENSPDYVDYYIQKGKPIYFVKDGESLYDLDEVELPNFTTVPECTSSVINNH